MKLKLNNVRLAFPSIFEPRQVNGQGKAAFSASLLFEPNSEAHKAASAVIKAAAAEKWGAKGDAVLKTLLASDKVCLHDGDAKSNYAGFEGMKYISARSLTRPLVLDERRQPLVEADGKPYGGCYVNALLDIWAQDNQFGKRVNATLSGLQFLRDGDAFVGGATASEEDFDDVTAPAMADDLV